MPELLRGTHLVGVFTQRIAALLATEYDLATRPLPKRLSALDHYMVWHNRYDEDRKHAWLRHQVELVCNRN